MTPYESISEALAKTGGVLECECVVAFPDLDAWTVALDEESELELAFDERLGLIHVSADVGVCPNQPDKGLLETLLQYNEQWLATGGVRFGLDGARRQFTLTASFPSSDIEAETLARRLAGLGNLIREWRSLLSDGRNLEAAIAPSPDDFVVKI
jgi:Tir chaperone protein (CesT) family